MKQNSKKHFPEEPGMSRPCGQTLWKGVALVAVGAALILGLTGCDLNEVLMPFGAGDIPFEQYHTAPTDMGAVDDQPRVPNDDDFDSGDFRPF